MFSLHRVPAAFRPLTDSISFSLLLPLLPFVVFSSWLLFYDVGVGDIGIHLMPFDLRAVNRSHRTKLCSGLIGRQSIIITFNRRHSMRARVRRHRLDVNVHKYMNGLAMFATPEARSLGRMECDRKYYVIRRRFAHLSSEQ